MSEPSEQAKKKKAHEIVVHCLESEVFCDLYYGLLEAEGWSMDDTHDCFMIVEDVRRKHAKLEDKIKLT